MKEGLLIFSIIICKHAYCTYNEVQACTSFGSTGIISMFAKIYGKMNNPPLVIGMRILLLTMVGCITCTMQDKNWQWRY